MGLIPISVITSEGKTIAMPLRMCSTIQDRYCGWYCQWSCSLLIDSHFHESCLGMSAKGTKRSSFEEVKTQWRRASPPEKALECSALGGFYGP